ncbi:MAG TPA: DUF4349 domain-containing protein [Anaerolineae bacterium]|nr:DUF4349 domain-containing protein [Anaerolineae bacterium]
MNRKIMYGVIASLLALAVAGCGRAAAPEPAMDVAYEAPAGVEFVEVENEVVVAESGAGVGEYAAIERLIIRDASLSMVVPDTEAALDEINDLVDELGGYVVESNTYQYQEGQRASVRFRIPAESLDVALDRIRALASEVRSQNISGKDLTDEYVDRKSSLRHLEATEARLLEFLEEAEDTEAALAVYEPLQEVQAQIEQVKGRIQYLEQSAAMATVSLEIIPDELAQPIQVGGWHPEGTLRNAFESLVRVLRFLVDAAIVIVVLVIPVLAVIAVPIAGLILLVRAIVRRRRARRAKTAA